MIKLLVELLIGYSRSPLFGSVRANNNGRAGSGWYPSPATSKLQNAAREDFRTIRFVTGSRRRAPASPFRLRSFFAGARRDADQPGIFFHQMQTELKALPRSRVR